MALPRMSLKGNQSTYGLSEATASYGLKAKWEKHCGWKSTSVLNSSCTDIELWRGQQSCRSRVGSRACRKNIECILPCDTNNDVDKKMGDKGRSANGLLCRSPDSQSSSQCCKGLKVAAHYARNDAKLVNARAREGIIILARQFQRLDRRAREDVALLGSEFLKLDARARQDTERLDSDARKKAARLRSLAEDLTDKAQISIRTAAEEHWSDGALDADLRLADIRAKRRAMEDAYISLQLVKSVHDGMVKKIHQREEENQKDMEPSGRNQYAVKSTSSECDRLVALQDAYWAIASALVEADGVDFSDPDELEFLVAALVDMDAMDGASSASLLAECANSPDVATRQALVNALGNAPSMWALGNAGMGALQRLSQDSNPAVAAAASKALEELEHQWQIDGQDMLIFRPDTSSDQEKLDDISDDISDE